MSDSPPGAPTRTPTPAPESPLPGPSEDHEDLPSASDDGVPGPPFEAMGEVLLEAPSAAPTGASQRSPALVERPAVAPGAEVTDDAPERGLRASGELRTTGELRGSLSYPILPRARRAPHRITGPRALVAAFVLLAACSLLLQLCTIAQVPTEADWLAAAQRVRADWAPGDVVRLEPAWATQGLQFLRDLELDLIDHPEASTLGRYRRLWVLAPHGHDCAADPPHNASVRERWEFGAVSLCRLSLLHRGTPTYDFLAQLKDAHVRRIHPKEKQECLLLHQGEWHCGKVHPWAYVGPVVKDVDDNPRKAIWAHPLDRGLPLEITYPAVPMGRELALAGGLTLRSILSGEGSPVHFEVRVDGEVVLERTLAPTQKGWFHWPVDTTRWDGQVVPVSFTVWAKDNQVRQFLFAGHVWKR